VAALSREGRRSRQTLPRGPCTPRARTPGEGGVGEMPWSGRADPPGLRADAGMRAGSCRQRVALARVKEEAAQGRIQKGPRASPPGTCIGHGAVASASVAYAAGADVGASRETPEEPWANETWALLSDEESRGFEAALRQAPACGDCPACSPESAGLVGAHQVEPLGSGFDACAADAGVGAPRETPAEP